MLINPGVGIEASRVPVAEIMAAPLTPLEHVKAVRERRAYLMGRRDGIIAEALSGPDSRLAVIWAEIEEADRVLADASTGA